MIHPSDSRAVVTATANSFYPHHIKRKGNFNGHNPPLIPHLTSPSLCHLCPPRGSSDNKEVYEWLIFCQNRDLIITHTHIPEVMHWITPLLQKCTRMEPFVKTLQIGGLVIKRVESRKSWHPTFCLIHWPTVSLIGVSPLFYLWSFTVKRDVKNLLGKWNSFFFCTILTSSTCKKNTVTACKMSWANKPELLALNFPVWPWLSAHTQLPKNRFPRYCQTRKKCWLTLINHTKKTYVELHRVTSYF